MRIIQAECTVRYTGRCETFFSPAVRLIMIKEDASVAVHVDSGYKPLNYMKASKELGFIEQDGHKILHAANSKEELYIDMIDILYDVRLPFPDSEREMIKTGTEDLLQEEIYRTFSTLIPSYSAICREFETGKGPVDVFGMADDDSGVALVEVKRHAHRKDVYQILKYEDGMAAMVADAYINGINAIEAKRKGDNDGTGIMVPVTALENRKLYLAARKFSRGTEEEALEHNIGILRMQETENIEQTVKGTVLPAMPKGSMTVLSTKQLGKNEILPMLEEVRRFLVEARNYYPQFDKWFDNKVIPAVLADRRELLYCLSHDTGILCGVAILKKTGEKKICSLRVSPNYRRRGIGTALVMEASRRLSCDHPMITTPGFSMNEMRPFLEKLGFSLFSKEENYYQEGETEYVYNGSLPLKRKN